MQGKLLILLGFFATNGLFAQQIEVKGGFVNEHFKVGEEVHYWMSARYPLEVNLLLPDSTYSFSPFEYLGKTYYQSTLQNGQVYDTVIYRLQSFEIDKVQHLGLPAIILKEKDSIQVMVDPDSLLLYELAPIVTDTTQLKTNLQYAQVDKGFNYPLFWILMGVLAVFIVGTILIFGKKILLAFKLRRLRKEYLKFSDYLTEQIGQLRVSPNPQTAEETMSEWKKYFEMLESKPYSKLTSKEILQLNTTEELREPLNKIDRFVYGGQGSEALYKEFQSIEDFTQYRYGKIVEELKHGK